MALRPATLFGLVPALLICGSVAHAARPPLDVRIDATRKAADIFVQMCIKGEARLKPGMVVEIKEKDVPDYVRNLYRRAFTARYYRLSDGPFSGYALHLVDPKAKDTEFQEVCAVGGQNLESNEAFVPIARVFNTIIEPGSLPKRGGEWYYQDVSGSFQITVKNFGQFRAPFVLMQSSVYNADDKARILKQRQDDATKRSNKAKTH